jgi:DNA-binding NarL/FixJ family response regulator
VEVDGAAAILVVDDHELVGSLVVLGLERRGFRAVRCPVTTEPAILEAGSRFVPGLVLLDLDLGTGSGTERIDELALVRGFVARGWRVLVVSAVTDRRRVAAAISAGAAGLLSKAAPLEELVASVAATTEGRRLLSESERASWLAIHRETSRSLRDIRTRLRRLTGREREVLELLARGERAAAIADRAVVSLSTVRSQIRSVLAKLEVNSQLEAVALLRQDAAGIAGPDVGTRAFPAR